MISDGTVQGDGIYPEFNVPLFNLSTGESRSFEKWDEGDINNWILNQVLAPNPFVRYITSLMYLSNVNGLSRINYPDSKFMKSINFNELKDEGKPHIFHNAWNLDKQKLSLFSNRPFTSKLEKDSTTRTSLTRERYVHVRLFRSSKGR